MYRLLIADDEPLEREALRLFVAESGLDLGPVLECGNGGDAVRLCLLERPDIVLLDINMPGLGGLEVLEKIRVADKRAKVIISSAYNYFEYAKKAMQLGALDFLVKPAKQAVVIAALTKAVDELDAEQSADERLARIAELMDSIGGRIAFDLASGTISDEAQYYLDTMGLGPQPAGAAYHIRLLPSESGSGEETARELVDLLSFLDVSVIWGHRDGRLLFLVFSGGPCPQEALFLRIRELFASAMDEEESQRRVGMGTPFCGLDGVQTSYSAAREDAADPEEEGSGREQREEQGTRGTPAEIERIRAFIEGNYTHKIGLDDIAEAAGSSKFHICRLFKQSMGVTIVDYLTTRRMEKAKELLKGGDRSIKQISAMVGYSDPNYFTWTFKKAEGISPVKYRYANGVNL